MASSRFVGRRRHHLYWSRLRGYLLLLLCVCVCVCVWQMVDKHGRQVSASDTPKYWLSLPFEILPFSSRPSFRFKIFFLFLFLPADLISCNFRRMFFFPTVGVFYFGRGVSIPAVYSIPFVDVIIELFFNKRCASWWLRINPVSMTTSFFWKFSKKKGEGIPRPE
jgi:hypothetical protein